MMHALCFSFSKGRFGVPELLLVGFVVLYHFRSLADVPSLAQIDFPYKVRLDI